MDGNWKNLVLKTITEIDPKKEIVINFDEGKKQIEFAPCVKQHKKQNFEDEAYVRAYLVLRLIKELKYPCEKIELEKRYSIGHKSTKEARLDILVKDKKNNPFMLIECKTPDNFDREKYPAIENQLYALASREIRGNIKPKYLVLYTVDVEDGKLIDKSIVIDFEQYPTYEDWIEAGEPILDSIPKEYGIATKFFYANIEEPDEEKGLKPLRKDYTFSDFEKLRVDLHNKLWAGGESDYNDIFYHLIKIMLVKVYDELFTPEGEIYNFQILYKDRNPETPQELAKRLEKVYKKALRDLLNYDEERIKEVPFIERDKFTYEKLVYAVEKLQSISLTQNLHSKDEDVLGMFFEAILQNEFKQSKGQYFTHRNIVRFLIYALELDKLAIQTLNQTYPRFPRIIDPSAGSGTFLIEVMKIITKEVIKNEKQIRKTRLSKRLLKAIKDPEEKHKWAEDDVYGIEPNARLGLATKLNMILHGDGNMNIFIEDGLLPFRIKNKPVYSRKWKDKDEGLLAESSEVDIYPRPVNERFDALISNPPFSLKLEAMKSYKYIKDTFIYYDKKNSENLFIERYFQLLAPNGRLGVVIPDSVLDTTENLYIRNFLYKYFKIKAIISLPKEAFEPYTSTKVSLLLAQKKTHEEVKEWEDKWREYSNEYNKLRRSKIIQFFLENEKIISIFRPKNKSKIKEIIEANDWEIDYSITFVWELENDKNFEQIMGELYNSDKKKYDEITSKIDKFFKEYNLNKLDNEENRKILKRFLKNLYPEESNFSTFEELLKYIYDDVLEIANLDYPQVSDENNYCNSWWVFGEVSKYFDYSIFYAEIENLGYKRTKRGEQDKDIPIKDKNGNIVAFKNDFFKVKAEKVKRPYWTKVGKKVVQEEKEEIIKTDVMIDTEKPETVLDYLRKANIWSENPKFDFGVK